jgi:CHAT domain-containing protein
VRPLEAELAGEADVAWSLDGALRYVPLAALWDGEGFLAERRPTALFTGSTAAGPAGPADAADPAARGPATARALGVTAAWPPFPALAAVGPELAAVVRTPSSPEGVLEGEMLLDPAFTRKAFADSLASAAPVVHVASHFLLSPGSLANTELLLGDGTTLNLQDIRRDTSLDFAGLALLTLSACDTASGGRGGVGSEVESFGEIVQARGARAVLASLWPVDDVSTAGLMREFYRLRYIEGKGKAEALRGAQLSLMKAGAPAPAAPAASAGGMPADAARTGAATSVGGAVPEAGRGVPIPAAGTSAPAAPAESLPPWPGSRHSHPFYWAAFVLMGDWQ